MKGSRGVTLIEIVIVIVIIGILASGFVRTFVPMTNTFFYFPQSLRVNNAAADLLQVLAEGDEKAEGLRYTGPPCKIATGCSPGSSTITAADNFTLTYYYAEASDCGGASCAASTHDVVLTYDATNDVFTRAVDGATANIPSYVSNASDINFEPFETNSQAESTIFRYFNSAGTELTTPVADTTTIYRVDIAVQALSGSGQVRHNAGQIRMKTGVDIKRYTT